MSDLKLIWKPSVYIIGRQEIDRHDLSQFLLDTGDSGWESDATSPGQEIVEICGKVCYRSFKSNRPGGNKAYIENILKHSHGSVTEHSVWTLLVTGVSRSLSLELVRHRVGVSPSQESQRYVDCSGVAFVVPPALMRAVRWYDGQEHWRTGDDHWLAGKDWVETCVAALVAYERLADYLLGHAPAVLEKTDKRKWARQAARSVLPECAETRMALTMNGRAIRHFLELRSSQHADVEIRRLSNSIYEKLRNEAPVLFGDYTMNPLPDGTYELVTDHKKV